MSNIDETIKIYYKLLSEASINNNFLATPRYGELNLEVNEKHPNYQDFTNAKNNKKIEFNFKKRKFSLYDVKQIISKFIKDAEDNKIFK